MKNSRFTQPNCIISISLPVSQLEFIRKEHLSLSKITQDAISQFESVKNGDLLMSNSSLQAKVVRMNDYLQKAMEFIGEKGLSNEFLEK